MSPLHCTGQPIDASQSPALLDFFAGEGVENSSFIRPLISQTPSTPKAMYTTGHSHDTVVLTQTERSEVCDTVADPGGGGGSEGSTEPPFSNSQSGSEPTLVSNWENFSLSIYVTTRTVTEIRSRWTRAFLN